MEQKSKSKIERIIETLQESTLKEIKEVASAAQELAERISSWQEPEETKRETVTYRQEYIRCGKANCKKCRANGTGHGPYWYAYWREGKRIRKEYIGKKNPKQV